MKIIAVFIIILSLFAARVAIRSSTTGINYYISPSGNDANTGTSADNPFLSIQKALDLAQPGDTVNLAPGIYHQDIVTRRNGAATTPITLTGTVYAVVKGAGNARIFEVNHDYIPLQQFTIDGLFGNTNSPSGYRDKLLYLQGKETRKGVEGVKIFNMIFINAGGECLRLRYFGQNNEVAFSRFENCGVYDFRFGAGGKNGEAVYIGTAPEQRGDGKNPTSDPDQSTANWIHHNFMNTLGNECV